MNIFKKASTWEVWRDLKNIVAKRETEHREHLNEKTSSQKVAYCMDEIEENVTKEDRLNLANAVGTLPDSIALSRILINELRNSDLLEFLITLDEIGDKELTQTVIKNAKNYIKRNKK